MYIVRISKSGKFTDSAPCVMCYKTMKFYGVKTIVYSNNKGGITKMRLNDYTPKTLALGDRYVLNGYDTVVKRGVDDEDTPRIIKQILDKMKE